MFRAEIHSGHIDRRVLQLRQVIHRILHQIPVEPDLGQNLEKKRRPPLNLTQLTSAVATLLDMLLQNHTL